MGKKIKIKSIEILPPLEEPKALYLVRELSLLSSALSDNDELFNGKKEINRWIGDVYSGKLKIKDIDEKIAFVKSAENTFIKARKSKYIEGVVYDNEYLVPALYGLINAIIKYN